MKWAKSAKASLRWIGKGDGVPKTCMLASMMQTLHDIHVESSALVLNYQSALRRAFAVALLRLIERMRL